MSTLYLERFSEPAILTSAESEHRKRTAIAEAACITAVTNPFEADFASQSLVTIRRLIKECEESRKAVKEPVLKLGRQIDAVASAFAADLDSHANRLSRYIAHYQAEQTRIAAEAERKRQEEIAKIERERRIAEEKARREAEEAARLAKTAEDVAAVNRKAVELAEAAKVEAARKAAAVVAVPVQSPQKLEGISMRKVWRVEVTDAAALHGARPELVELRPRIADITAAVAAGAKLPGVRAWQEDQARVRA